MELLNRKLNHSLFLICLTVYLIGCDNFVEKPIKIIADDINEKNQLIISYFQSIGSTNCKSIFLDFVIIHDSIKIKDCLIQFDSDSVFLIPGNMLIEDINKSDNLLLPGIYTPEGKSFMIFKKNNKHTKFINISDDTLFFDLQSNQKLGYSKTDSDLLITKIVYPNGRLDLKISDKKIP